MTSNPKAQKEIEMISEIDIIKVSNCCKLEWSHVKDGLVAPQMTRTQKLLTTINMILI